MNKKIEKKMKSMDKETQEAIKILINHLMVKKTKKEHGISENERSKNEL